MICIKCNGTKWIPINTMKCSCCNGTGEYHGKCLNCMGRGYIAIVREPCDMCNGKGFRDWIDEMRRPEREI